MSPLILPILEIGRSLIEKLVPDPQEKAKLEQSLLQAAQQNDLKELEIRMSTIIAEASSNDPWTSRARPSFMYVIYILLLFAIPMGFVSAFKLELATAIANGFGAWLAAIPDELYALFGAGYLGYAYSRTVEKKAKVTK